MYRPFKWRHCSFLLIYFCKQTRVFWSASGTSLPMHSIPDNQCSRFCSSSPSIDLVPTAALAVDLSYNLSKLHISAEVCLPITHQKELTAHLRQDDPPSKRIIHQRRFRTKFLCGNTCVWTLQLVMVCIYEKKKWMDTVWRWWGTSGCKRLQMWRWLQHGAATHTFKCFPWIDPGYCKRAFIICVATFSLDGWQHFSKWSSSVLIVKSSLSTDLLGLVVTQISAKKIWKGPTTSATATSICDSSLPMVSQNFCIFGYNAL